MKLLHLMPALLIILSCQSEETKTDLRVEKLSVINTAPKFAIAAVPANLQIKSNFDPSNFIIKKRGIFALWLDVRETRLTNVDLFLDRLMDVREKSLSIGYMDPPQVLRGYYFNLYIHRDGADSFNQKWAIGVGTEYHSGEKHPYLTFTSRYFNNIPYTYHEGFHMFQYGANSPGFKYSGSSGWYIESSADWFALLETKKLAAFPITITANPHINLWQSWNTNPDDPSDWLWNVRQYHTSTFLYFLTESKNVDRDIITRGFYEGTELLPQEYLYSNIGGDKFRGYFADWAVHNTAGVDYISRPNQPNYPAGLGENYPDPDNMFPYINEHSNVGIEGVAGRPDSALTPRGWGYNVIKINNDQSTNYNFKVIGDTNGSSGAASHFEARILVKGNDNRFIQVPMTNATDGSITVNVSESESEIYLIVAAVPQHFSGIQTYSYKYEIETSKPSLDPIVSYFNTSGSSWARFENTPARNCISAIASGWLRYTCDRNAPYACVNPSNRNDWTLSANEGTGLQYDNSCPVGYVFGLPRNIEESNLLRVHLNVKGAHLNATDSVTEGIWITTDVALTSEPELKDIRPTDWCVAWQDKGFCSEPFIKTICAKTCSSE